MASEPEVQESSFQDSAIQASNSATSIPPTSSSSADSLGSLFGPGNEVRRRNVPIQGEVKFHFILVQWVLQIRDKSFFQKKGQIWEILEFFEFLEFLYLPFYGLNYVSGYIFSRLRLFLYRNKQ